MWLRHRCSCWRPAPQRTRRLRAPRRSWDPSPAPSGRHDPRTSFPRRGVLAAAPRPVGAAIDGTVRNTSCSCSPAGKPVYILPTTVAGLRSSGSSVPGEWPRSPARDVLAEARSEAEGISAAPAQRHPVRQAEASSVPPLPAVADSAGLCLCPPCRWQQFVVGGV